MAQSNSKSKQNSSQNDEHDPLFNLKHAQAEAELAKNTGGLGPTTNVYVTSDEEASIDEATVPRDSQGFHRGENTTDIIGSHAGDH